MKGKRPRRKVVLFLVEGQTEINTLKPAISALYDSIDPDIEVFFPTIVENDLDRRGDITSMYGITPDVIEGCIYKLFLKNFFDVEKLYPKDISEIIQIVDLDGAYIPDDLITCGDNPNGEDKPYYDESNGIIAKSPDSIIQRNKRKRANLDYLSSLTEIHAKSKRPKYSVYFFSGNLDHFLFGNANMTFEQKIYSSDEYALHYALDPEAFVAAVNSTPGVLTGMDYDESWRFIKKGNNSIQRHSNINILFERLIEEANENE